MAKGTLEALFRRVYAAGQLASIRHVERELPNAMRAVIAEALQTGSLREFFEQQQCSDPALAASAFATVLTDQVQDTLTAQRVGLERQFEQKVEGKSSAEKPLMVGEEKVA